MNAWVNIITKTEILSINLNNVTRMSFNRDSKNLYVTLVDGKEWVYTELTEENYRRMVGA